MKYKILLFFCIAAAIIVAVEVQKKCYSATYVTSLFEFQAGTGTAMSGRITLPGRRIVQIQSYYDVENPETYFYGKTSFEHTIDIEVQ